VHCKDASGNSHWLDVAYDLEQVDIDSLRTCGRVWDYDALLPLDRAAAVSLGEGGTPLLRLPALNVEIGLPDLYLKVETGNPTGSFKDRFQTVSMSVARSLGYPRAAIVTTGNAGSAAAAYAAAAGIRLVAITDPVAPEEQRRMMGFYGAVVTAPSRPGPVVDNARELIDTLVRDHGCFPTTVQGTYAGPANPYGVEGYKTIGFEVWNQLGRVPDRVCVPTSGGDALYGPYKAFTELVSLGVADRVPAMVACQAAGAGFLAESLRRGDGGVAVVVPDTFALSIADPTGSPSALRAISETSGDAWTATDDELLAAMRLLARHGICVEAASAAPLAALRSAAAEGRVDVGETVVAVLTGGGQKWPAQLDRAVPRAGDLAPDDLSQLLHLLEDHA
jgi:threonine synthase